MDLHCKKSSLVFGSTFRSFSMLISEGPMRNVRVPQLKYLEPYTLQGQTTGVLNKPAGTLASGLHSGATVNAAASQVDDHQFNPWISQVGPF